MLVGRDRERDRLRTAALAACDGHGSSIVLRGEPGIGKTTLLDDLCAAAEGMLVLQACGVEWESRLAYAGLSDVLAKALGRLDDIPAAQAAALRAALALGPPVVPDRFAAYAATLSLLGAAAADEPVLIVVDDAHWIDAPTMEALTFCARRIAAEPVLIVVASRERGPERLDAPGFDELVLEPLGPAAARALLDAAAAGEVVAEAVVERLLALADGNPLALVELPGLLEPEQRTGAVPLGRVVAPGDAISRAYRRRIDDLDEGARRAAVLAATSLDEASGPILAALESERYGAAAATRAQDAGVIELAGPRLRVRHPLLRSVVLASTPPAEQRSAHLALAASLDGGGDPDQRAWHLAEAATGPDEEAASSLERAGIGAAGRTGYAAAAHALERAADLSPDPVVGEGRRLTAVNLALAAADGRHAARLLGQLSSAESTEVRTRVRHLHGFLTMMSGDADAAFGLLSDAARDAADTDPALAAGMLADAGLTRAMAGDCRAALQTLRMAQTVAGAEGRGSTTARNMFASALVLCGEARTARGLLADLDRAIDVLDPLTPEGQSLVIALTPRTWIEDFETARRHLTRWESRARDSGAVALIGFPLAFQAELDFRIGRWDDAAIAAQEAVRLLEETGQESPLTFALATRAILGAGRGEETACRSDAARALEIAEARNLGSIVAYARAALGSLELASGRADAAVGHLEPLVAYVEERGLREPAAVQWQPDLIEAYVRLSRIREARSALRVLAEQADRTGGTWARAAACRGRGMIDADFDRHFAEALRLHRMTPTPFERARTELAWGTRLRRAGRRREARTHMDAALSTFGALRAHPWTRLTGEELGAAGGPVPGEGWDGVEGLSPREMQVARAVAEGATNREVAARLFLSEKTVEHHLGNIFRKLGLRSRTQLVARIVGSSVHLTADAAGTHASDPGSEAAAGRA